MMKLYHCVSARSFRALWMLEELGLPYELQMLPFPPRALAKSYLELNPLGTVPLFLNGADRLTESSAICQYLCSLAPDTPLAVHPGDSAYASYLNWLHMSDATLTFPQTLVLRYTHFEPEARRQRRPGARLRDRGRLRRRLGEGRVRSRRTAGAGRPSALRRTGDAAVAAAPGQGPRGEGDARPDRACLGRRQGGVGE